ncbi:hypothetical protein [Pseudoalteromonas aurantia]|uniref:tRNA 2-thiouridine synthesizing protein B n=1 Tax=Pseudoalteromonas aurantia 208 TaxID=1314867 RepID=A0ABR9EA39_9GAMM|nr:hypothetical protein [Pseudoalteromonas aurantia]MBE0367844.1 tRNA 2-thiouridine synthesizing protein B [Pseudoalteromonas aurantia 208]
MINTVHIFSRPLSRYNTHSISMLLSDTDRILLIADACYDQTSFKNLTDNGYILSQCLSTRGVELQAPFSAISDIEWVQLIDGAKKTITW